MNNAEILRMLLSDLRLQKVALDSNPLIPSAVKLAVDTSTQILEILISEAHTHE